jgi:hypothetical protein
MMTTMKEKAFNVFREHFPDLTLEYMPLFSNPPHEYVWKIFSKWGGVGGRESNNNNAVLMRWTKSSDTIALRKSEGDSGGEIYWIEYHHGRGGDIAHLGRAIQTYFPETVADRTGTIAFIFSFPNGDTLMQRAHGYDEGTEICEFPFFVENTWLEFLHFMHGIGVAIDTEANADVIRLDYGRNDFAVIIRVDLAPAAVVDHLFKKIGYGATFGLRNFGDVYIHAMGDCLNMTPETAHFMRERLEYNFRPKKMLKVRQEEKNEGWLGATHGANNNNGGNNKRRGNFDGDGDDEMMMMMDRNSCCGGGGLWSQNKRPNY